MSLKISVFLAGLGSSSLYIAKFEKQMAGDFINSTTWTIEPTNDEWKRMKVNMNFKVNEAENSYWNLFDYNTGELLISQNIIGEEPFNQELFYSPGNNENSNSWRVSIFAYSGDTKQTNSYLNTNPFKYSSDTVKVKVLEPTMRKYFSHFQNITIEPSSLTLVCDSGYCEPARCEQVLPGGSGTGTIPPKDTQIVVIKAVEDLISGINIKPGSFKWKIQIQNMGEEMGTYSIYSKNDGESKNMYTKINEPIKMPYINQDISYYFQNSNEIVVVKPPDLTTQEYFFIKIQ